MITFTAIIKQFKEKGEKTGWMYIEVPSDLALKLAPGNKKAFRIKGKLDAYEFSFVSLIPMGGGDFIMAINATMRKNIRKGKGAMIAVTMEADHQERKPPAELMECMADEPDALHFFLSLPKSHQ